MNKFVELSFIELLKLLKHYESKRNKCFSAGSFIREERRKEYEYCLKMYKVLSEAIDTKMDYLS
jgi:hypothetical protein